VRGGVAAAAAALAIAGTVAGCRGEPEVLGSIIIEPTPTPTLSPGNAARVAFADMLLDDTLSYHATIDGSLHGAGNIVEFSGTMDAAGQDYQIAVAYDFPAAGQGRTAYANRLVGGVPYVRPKSGKWTRDSGFTADETNNPFAFINHERDIKFLKTEVIGGRTLHRLRFETSLLITPRQVPADNYTQERIVRSWFELTVDDAGKPLDGHWRLEGRGRVSGQLQETIIQADLLFTKVGEAITISAP
jgi:hypothetical protein